MWFNQPPGTTRASATCWEQASALSCPLQSHHPALIARTVRHILAPGIRQLTRCATPPLRTEAREELRRQVGTLRFDLNTLASTKAKEEKKVALAARKEFLAAVSGTDSSAWLDWHGGQVAGMLPWVFCAWDATGC